MQFFNVVLQSEAPLNQIAAGLGANDLPYSLPIHPNLVHLTIGLFVIAIAFDFAGALYPLEKRIFRFLALPVTRAGFHDVGWYNLLACSVISFFTVAAGFYEMLTAVPLPGVISTFGLEGFVSMARGGRSFVARSDCFNDNLAWLPAFPMAQRSWQAGAMDLSF